MEWDLCMRVRTELGDSGGAMDGTLHGTGVSQTCYAEEGRLVGEVQQVGACGAKLMGGGGTGRKWVPEFVGNIRTLL